MPHLNDIKEPLAVAMWSFSYLQRRYRGEGFEDFDKALDELLERGYNAVRIDVFPHMIALDPQGKRCDVYRVGSGEFSGLGLWNSVWSTEVNTREVVIEFISKCQQRGIYVGLSTWFGAGRTEGFEPSETYEPLESGARPRCERFEGLDEFVRAWDETLQFLEENDCLKTVVYVDLLNEYPYVHKFTWLTRMLDTMREPTGYDYNDRQKSFYRQFINDAIKKLSARWPELDFFASQTQNAWGRNETDMDYSRFGLLDIHLWFVHHLEFSKEYFEHIDHMKNDIHWAEAFKAMMGKWHANKDEYIGWADCKIQVMSEVAEKWKLPLGNTEGWGAIHWEDHPSLGWDWIKETGEIGATLGAKYGYAFNNTSDFCQPNFVGMWEDIEYHRRVTDIIRSAQKRTWD